MRAQVRSAAHVPTPLGVCLASGCFPSATFPRLTFLSPFPSAHDHAQPLPLSSFLSPTYCLSQAQASYLARLTRMRIPVARGLTLSKTTLFPQEQMGGSLYQLPSRSPSFPVECKRPGWERDALSRPGPEHPTVAPLPPHSRSSPRPAACLAPEATGTSDPYVERPFFFFFF